jgi:DNA-binding winged helix-turn-helix (wHTH) protein/TolB-like protein/Tfp pilus assembly protein PilF
MENADHKRLIYEFDGFVLDPNERTLTVNGVPVHLPAKEFDTLSFLVEHSGRAVSKDEMMSAIWGDAFVEESNIAKQISRLRKLLNTGGNELIETIPKHGYRFKVSDLRVREAEPLEPLIVEKRSVKRMKFSYPPPTAVPELPPASSHQSFPRRAMWIAAGVLLIAIVGTGLYYRYSNPATARVGNAAGRSLAVLPFKPVGADGGDEYLRLGLADALITKLSSLKQIVVRPTNAVRNYGSHDPLAAGRQLGVDVVLDGNVQRIGQQIRVTVQLVNVQDGKVLWGSKFDENFTDIFALQDAISDHVARAIEPGLTGEERMLVAKRYTAAPDAHRAYVRGRILWNQRTGNDIREAIKYFNEAIERDPNYALAYSGLADANSLLADYTGTPPRESYGMARDAALKALELDQNLAEGHTSLAYVKMYYYWDWPGVEAGYRRAIELNQNYATAHQWYSEYLAAMGRFDEALAEIRRAKEIDPLAPVINAGEVWILYFARRYDEAIETGKKLQDTNPDFAEINEYLKRCYDQKGMYREAITARQMRRKLVGIDPTESSAIKRAAAATNHEAYWKSRLEQEIDDAKREPPYPFDMAEIYAQLGEKDKAFAWLEIAYEQRTYLMMYLNVAPNLDPLRSDPRFADLLRRVGLRL